MSQKTKAQIQAESNSTYVDNTVGSITPANVRTLNTDWIDSIVFLDMTGSFIPTNAVSASSAATASFLLGSIASASFANTAATASLALTASSTPNAFVSVSQPLVPSDFTIVKGDGSGTTITINNVQSASYADIATSSSLATRNLTTASAVANILTFTKGDGTTFNVTIAQSGSVASASYADVANFANSATSASYAFTASSATNSANAISASFAVSASRAISAATAVSATTATSALTAISASQATNANTALTATSASQATNANNALTASFVAGVATLSGNNTLSGINTFNNAVTMSNVQINGTASIQYLNVVFQSSSIIYSSGSNQLGDAANDTQTLWGTVNVISGPLVVTGSANFASVITGSISTALNANTASYVANAFISASQVGGNDKVSLTTAGGTITTLTINNVASANSAGSANTATSASFATTAGTANTAITAATASSVSALNQTVTITGSLNALGVVNFTGGDFKVTDQNRNAEFDVDYVKIKTVNGTQITGSLNVSGGITGSLFGNAISASFANTSVSASIAQLALTASYFDGLVASASYALVAETANTALTANTANSALTAINADTASFVSGNVASASYAATASGVQGINASLVNSTYYLGFVPNASPNAISIDTDLSYNPSTGVLSSNQFTGALNGNASTATTATSATSASFAISSSRAISAESVTSASFAQSSVTASFATNFRNSGSYVITGSHRGNVVSQSIASSTASFDFSTGNFFTLNLTGSTLTHISASNIQAGQTVNVRISQGATTGSVSFSPAFDQVSGSAYVPTQVANAVDILTFITFDNSLIYVSNIKNLV